MSQNKIFLWFSIQLALDPTSFPDVLPFLVSMVHHGFVSRVREMSLDMDLGSLPTHYLPSLASSIWGRVRVHPLNSCDLSPFLDSFKGEIILIDSQFLDDEETRALERNFEPCYGSKIFHNKMIKCIKVSSPSSLQGE